MTPVLNFDEKSVFAAMRYAIGLSDEPPANTFLGIAPERIRSWWQKWLATHPSVRVTLRKPTPGGAVRSSARSGAATPPADSGETFMEAAVAWAREHKQPLCAGMSVIARQRPALYEKHLEQMYTLTALRVEHDQLQTQLDVRQRVAAHKNQRQEK
jgi:hypothetical protein